MSYGRSEGKDVIVFLEKQDEPEVTREESKQKEAGEHKEQDGNSTSTLTDASSTAQDSQQAFNEETGEINWDCPCLGGMANGPCGEQFKEAFSCFVYSKEEPKGLDCVEQFRAMQECFKQHPDIYSTEEDEE